MFFVLTISSQELDEYTLPEIASLVDSVVEESGGGKIKTVLKKENDVMNFYVDSQVKDFTSSASYKDYKTINGIVIAVAITLKRVSWKSDKVWFLRDGEKVAWISIDSCKSILGGKSKSPSYLFEAIHLVDIDDTILHQVAF